MDMSTSKHILPNKTQIVKSSLIKFNNVSGITQEFVASVDEFIKKYRFVLEELAKR